MDFCNQFSELSQFEKKKVEKGLVTTEFSNHVQITAYADFSSSYLIYEPS
jgi:hypothetical protein